MDKGKTILITGGAEFVGSNLCAYFLSKNYKGRCLNNLLTSYMSKVQYGFEEGIVEYVNVI